MDKTVNVNSNFILHSIFYIGLINQAKSSDRVQMSKINAENVVSIFQNIMP